MINNFKKKLHRRKLINFLFEELEGFSSNLSFSFYGQTFALFYLNTLNYDFFKI